jgi:hypothetical protein
VCGQSLLQPEETDEHARPDETMFAILGVLRSVVLKVKKNPANERPAISRPARDAREVLKEMAADGEERLVGIFSADLVVCRQTLSTSNGDAGTFCGDCDCEGHVIGKYYVDIRVRRTACCTFPTIASLSTVVGPNVIAYLAACKSWGEYRGKIEASPPGVPPTPPSHSLAHRAPCAGKQDREVRWNQSPLRSLH